MPVAAAATVEEKIPLRTRAMASLRMAARIALAFPDVGRGWVVRAARLGRTLHGEHAFDAIVTSGPPHSAHFAGLFVALGNPSIKRIIDMRDPWRGGNKNWPLHGMDPHWIYPLIAPLEKILFRTTRTVIVNTSEFAEDLRAAEPRISVVHVSNGIDLETLPARTAERFEGISIAYVGTFYAGRSFSTVLAALKAIVWDRPEAALRIKLRIAGHIGSVQRDELRAALAQDGLDGMIEFLGAIPRRDALDLLRRSHVALVLAQQQRTQIPAKLYECVGLGVPTLVISELESAASREAMRIGAFAVETKDVARMREILNALLDGTFPANSYATVPISYERLALRLNQILGESVAGNGAEADGELPSPAAAHPLQRDRDLASTTGTL
jgi:glycosyltransferase involved in cell wall biosynthesis